MLQLIELRTTNYELESKSKKLERDLTEANEKVNYLDREWSKAKQALNKSKKAKDVELLIQESDSLQRKLLSQEEEFRLQNQTLMAPYHEGRSKSSYKEDETDPDNIAVELIEALEDFGIGKVTHLRNEIYNTGQILTNLSKSIFIALPKKPGATGCELHTTTSLMSDIIKILLTIIMLRVKNKIKPEIAEEQCVFVEDKGTSNAIYILRTLIERTLEVQKDVYCVSFIIPKLSTK
ncbi:grip1-associated protein 1 [Plakobranchus ocellatus]|uniref:Grip1-associated protein 1 n=1 Tax=Plakobranchus ocellatus TaxID=259542 RepID=A0AAV3Y5D2_9GAST|nr:grip1-associated protein 1 [Plakobranchus ocellatus]